MSVSPLPEDPPHSSVSQSNQSGHNVNVSGQGNTIHIHPPIEQLPRYEPTQEPPAPKPAYIPLSPSKPQSVHTEQDARNRAQLMDNVYHTWIEGVLLKNLKAGEFEISKELKPGAVLTDAEENNYRLTADDLQSIEVIFARMNHQLLILGKPGSGKTIHLLDLAHHLLAKAQADETQPVPVVLNLSSWIPEKPFEVWLIDELKRVYSVSEKTSRLWLEHRKLTLLLDGLDEIGRKRSEDDTDNNALREQCIEAINDYCHPSDRHGNHLFPVHVCVCSRIQDYLVLRRRLMIHNAIVLHDLSDSAVEAYLEGNSWIGARLLLDQEPSAHELARVPFLLNTMKTAYANIPYDSGTPPMGPRLKLSVSIPTENNRRNHLFEMYVRLMMSTVKTSEYSPLKIVHYLQWLAYQMVKHKTSVFYIEDLQPTMLEQIKKLRWTSELLFGLVFGLATMLIFGVGYALIGDFVLGLEEMLLIGLLIGLLFGTIVGLWGQGKIKLAEKMTFSLRHIKWHYLIAWGVGAALSYGLGAGLSGAVRAGNGNLLVFDALDEMRKGMIFSFGIGLVIGFTTQIGKSEDISRRQQSGSGLRASIINGLLVSGIGGIAIGLGFGFRNGTMIGLGSGIVSALLLFMGGDGYDLIRHITLRYLLAREGSIPPIHHFSITGGYDLFLDQAANIGLLRKVGGGYIFRHRMLMDYLAEQYEAAHPMPDTTPQP